MENFDLKKYLNESILLKEGFFDNMFGKKEKEQEQPIELDPSSPLNKVIINDPKTHSNISIGVILSKPEKYQHLFPQVQKAIAADPTGEKATAMIAKKAAQAKKNAKEAAWRRANKKEPTSSNNDEKDTSSKNSTSGDETQKIIDKIKSDLNKSYNQRPRNVFIDTEDDEDGFLGGFGGGGFSGGGSGGSY